MSDAILRKQLIRLAHDHPEFRADLLPIITAGDFDAGSIGKQVSGPQGGAGSDAAKPWAKGEFTQQENAELDKKQEGGGLGKSAAAMYTRAEVAKIMYGVMVETHNARRLLRLADIRAMGLDSDLILAFMDVVKNGGISDDDAGELLMDDSAFPM